jgi:hypothetical protein
MLGFFSIFCLKSDVSDDDMDVQILNLSFNYEEPCVI